jgi:hypothetical protein
MTLLSAEPPFSTSSWSAMTVEGLDEGTTDSRVCVEKVLDVVPKAWSPASSCDVGGSTGSTGGDMLFSSSESAIKGLRDSEGNDAQPRITDEMNERQHERHWWHEYSYPMLRGVSGHGQHQHELKEVRFRLHGRLHGMSVDVGMHHFGRMVPWCKSPDEILLFPHTVSMFVEPRGQ